MVIPGGASEPVDNIGESDGFQINERCVPVGFRVLVLVLRFQGTQPGVMGSCLLTQRDRQRNGENVHAQSS